jgi:hypothetical protein
VCQIAKLKLLLGRLLDVIDNHELDGNLCRRQVKAKLFCESRS